MIFFDKLLILEEKTGYFLHIYDSLCNVISRTADRLYVCIQVCCYWRFRLYSYAVTGVRAGTGACPYSGCIRFAWRFPPVFAQPFRLFGLARGPAPTVAAYLKPRAPLAFIVYLVRFVQICKISAAQRHSNLSVALRRQLGLAQYFYKSRLRREISQIETNRSDISGCSVRRILPL